MLNCEWAQALTRYDCQPLTALDGSACLEIGTPFSLPGGSAINLYITQAGDNMVRISDNADTMMQLNGMGLDVWQPKRLQALQELMRDRGIVLGPQGDVFVLSALACAANGFAAAVTGLLTLAGWAATQLAMEPPEQDVVATVEPYIIARDPTATFKNDLA